MGCGVLAVCCGFAYSWFVCLVWFDLLLGVFRVCGFVVIAEVSCA